MLIVFEQTWKSLNISTSGISCKISIVTKLPTYAVCFVLLSIVYPCVLLFYNCSYSPGKKTIIISRNSRFSMAAFEMIWLVGTSVGGFGLDIDIVDDDDEDDEEDMDGGDQQG